MTAARDAAPSSAEGTRLGPLESQVMDILWDRGPSSIREVINALDGRPAYTTIATVLMHLTRKGLVEPQKVGRSVRHGARVSREAHAASLMSCALAASGDRAASILHFVHTMPEDERALLLAYLTEQDPQGQR